MLRRIVAGSLVASSVGVVSLMVVPVPAAAQSANVVCAEYDTETQVCLLELTVSLDGSPPTVSAEVSGGGGGVQVNCDRGPHYNPDPQQAQLQEVPCQLQHGWYSQTYDCYFQQSDVSPDAEGVILPSGYQEGDDGAVYRAMCLTASHPDIPLDNYCFSCTAPDWFGEPHLVFLTSEPDGFGGTPDPVPDLLVQAIGLLALEAPAIGTAPPAGSPGLVRLPVWMWNELSPNNWGEPDARTPAIAGISVVAEARAVQIDWAFGDGSGMTCDEGVAWQPGTPVADPPCGHTYLRASRDQPSGQYDISATTLWELVWRTEGLPVERGGEFELDATSTDGLVVQELQVLYGHP